MAKLDVHICSETGICSIIKPGGRKVDLTPDEADSLKRAAGKPQAIKDLLADIDPGFSDSLDSEEVSELSEFLR